MTSEGAVRVLVVDDNEDAAAMLAEALTMMGFDTAVAHDGPAALHEAAQFHPDAALIDIGLPGMDGYELARRLRALPGLERARLVAVTGYGMESDGARSREAGFDRHLVKPVELATVSAMLSDTAEGTA